MQFTDQICAFLVAICATIPVAILGLLLGRAYRDGQRVRIIVYGLTFIHETALVALRVGIRVSRRSNWKRQSG